MTVRQWIDAYIWFYPHKEIRIIDSVTGKGLGNWWVPYGDRECLTAKITEKWIFLYI